MAHGWARVVCSKLADMSVCKIITNPVDLQRVCVVLPKKSEIMVVVGIAN